MPITDLLKGIPYTYKVGEKSSSALPVNVKLALDADFKKTVTKWMWIGSLSIAAGIATGIVISNSKKSR